MPFLQEYTMLDELGRGGFATVYKVRHNELGYIRAIRVLNETIVDADSPTYRKFLRECKVLLRLGNGNHPNIVHIYQPRLLDNKALVEMDYVDGQDILHYLQQNQNFVPVEEVIRMALQMSSALAYCHEDIYRFCMDRNADGLQDDPNDGSKVLIDEQTRKRLIEKYKVIHNDIHSGNIMRREDGNYVLLDFGLAIEGDEVVRSSRRKNGAPEFKAPEKWDNEAILTEQSDIYSFGVVLYQYLAGRVPFTLNTSNPNSTEAEYLLSKAHQKDSLPSIEGVRKDFYEKKFKGQVYKKDFPQWLEDVIMKCLQKNPADRFRNGKELYEYISMHALKKNKVLGESEENLERLKKQNEKLGSELENLRGYNKRLNEVVVDMEGRIQALREETHSLFGVLNDSTSPEPHGKKKSTWKWWVTVAILLLGVLALVLWLVLKPKPKPKPKPEHVIVEQVIEEQREGPQIVPSRETVVSKNGDLICSIGDVTFKMIFVKGGTFQMGSDSGDDDEKPVHSVTVSDFYMGEFEVTQALWQEVMGTTIYQQRDKANKSWSVHGVGADYPMYYVSYTEAEEFCGRLNQRLRSQLPDGYRFSLPTEAEWEYAARGGSKSNAYTYSGSNDLSDVGWYTDNSGESTHKVGSKRANSLGLYDMSGNVWEWCSDWYEDYRCWSSQTDPRDPSSRLSRVLRGGSWSYGASSCRVADRSLNGPSRRNFIGFRLAIVRR